MLCVEKVAGTLLLQILILKFKRLPTKVATPSVQLKDK